VRCRQCARRVRGMPRVQKCYKDAQAARHCVYCDMRQRYARSVSRFPVRGSRAAQCGTICAHAAAHAQRHAECGSIYFSMIGASHKEAVVRCVLTPRAGAYKDARYRRTASQAAICAICSVFSRARKICEAAQQRLRRAPAWLPRVTHRAEARRACASGVRGSA